jgi:hypothetical protein
MPDSQVKSILKKETLKKHVQFGVNKVIDDDEKPEPPPPEPNEEESVASPRPREVSKTKFKQPGKAKPIRQLCIFLGIIGVMLYCTRNFDISTHEVEEEVMLEDPPEDPVADTLNSVADYLVNFAMRKKGKIVKRTEDCSIFVNRGSVPGTGYSLFAGNDYAVGDTVLKLNGPLLPLFGETSTLCTPFAFLVKHHPTLANVEGPLVVVDSSSSDAPPVELIATRPIQAGDELFVEYLHHPASLLPSFFDHIPLPHEYEWAEELSQDARLTSNRMTAAHRKRGHQLKPEQFIMSLLRRSIEKFNPRVAALLRGRAPIGMDQHQMYSTCLQDIGIATTEEETKKQTIVATKSFQKGELLAFVPLYIYNNTPVNEAACKSNNETSGTESTFRSMWRKGFASGRGLNNIEGNGCENSSKNGAVLGEECAATYTNEPPDSCFELKKNAGTVVVCPLTTLGLIGSATSVNVELQWADEREGEDLLAASAGTRAWKLVALQDIETGQEVRPRVLPLPTK